jgi:membrane fusion protein (multidrug efflux system)
MSDEPHARGTETPPELAETASGNGNAHLRTFQAWQARSRQRLSRRRLAAFAVLGLLVLGAIAYGLHIWHYSQSHVSTDDAFVTGHIAPVSPRVGGTVSAVLVDDNQDVKAGDVLVRLDSRDYDVALAQAKAAVAAARGDFDNAMVNVPLADESTLSLLREADAALAATGHGQEMAEHDLEQRKSDLASKQAAVAAAEASLQGAQADFDRAKLDRDRAAELFKRDLLARQDLDHAEAAFRNAQAMLDLASHKATQARDDVKQGAAAVRSQEAAVAQAKQRVAQSQAASANALSQRQQVKGRAAQVDAARGHLELAVANLKQAQLNLDYTAIRAPSSGRVTKKSVEVGQVVAPGTAILSIVDLDDLWVVANYKETDLTGVKVGQRASIRVDSYPGTVFTGHVDSIQGGSGAIFSLLPPENATGNYVKVVQRIPVKIAIDRGETARHLLVPGMSAVPVIDLN